MAGIIKAGQPATAAAGASSVYHFDDLEDDSRNRARREAAKIIADAHAAAALLKAQAADEGRQAGHAAALASLREGIDQQAQSSLQALTRAVEAIGQSRQCWLAHWQQHAVVVAVAIARRIIRRELACAPDITVDLVREALELASGHERIVVRLNPADHANLGPQIAQVVEQLRLVGQAQIVAYEAIEPGGCKVEIDCGTIDAQIAAQLSRIAEELV